VADAAEAAREDVEQEPAEELVGRKDHRFQAVPVRVVLPPEAHLADVDAEESVVGEGHPVLSPSKERWA
jgi:hypothetical protein